MLRISAAFNPSLRETGMKMNNARPAFNAFQLYLHKKKKKKTANRYIIETG